MPQPLSTPNWRIEPVTTSTTNEVVRFINHARRAMFPELHAQLEDDVARWVQSGCFLCARKFTTSATEQEKFNTKEERGGDIIATIGYVPYDDRFAHLLQYNDGRRTVELVRLFVVPEYRRCGLASELVHAIKRCAAEEKEESVRLYLHTHPFLPGAISFWEKQGFRVVFAEEDEVWRTTHMEALMEGSTTA
ncbi:hypothetical protein yc1106_08658 [Curvularia clavata]|uniref:N-acetyltransferase domain-containing protein n=1 Tax=Curvularia clavata TaxID=95742 RepID=A0A9Q9DWZ0_CURCL|nr:hypothetical protein yc1106_08658 [Curvularia clavata]